jgi:hypothetical protein
LWYLERQEICWGGFERRRILGWWKWKRHGRRTKVKPQTQKCKRGGGGGCGF